MDSPGWCHVANHLVREFEEMARVSNANAITTTRRTLTEPNCLYLIFIFSFTVTMPYSFWSNDRGLWCSRWPQPIVGGDVELPTPNKPRCFPPRAAMAFVVKSAIRRLFGGLGSYV